ncbi:pantetheine-phosphate adenylyltransferase [Anaerosinus massiliensis]|uniref:pantetheine-phosphate adenylyltransferase n=1 Tax=Massilibacillus massiliensis TaxID=1806837 RepID=UPI000A7B413B|nr:pantetheine-phosphate adenylyltransferase [Massilibacillus massiliensis]
MRIAVCPGSFDPVTNGHIDIFERASYMFDEVIVGVFHNPNKKPMFTVEERVDLLKESTKHIKNIRVDSFSGLLSEYAKKHNTSIIIRGLRAIGDFEYEFQRALLIKKIDPEMETIFMMTSNEYSFLSSSGIKELAKFNGNIKGLVPECVEIKIKQCINKKM